MIVTILLCAAAVLMLSSGAWDPTGLGSGGTDDRDPSL